MASGPCGCGPDKSRVPKGTAKHGPTLQAHASQIRCRARDGMDRPAGTSPGALAELQTSAVEMTMSHTRAFACSGHLATAALRHLVCLALWMAMLTMAASRSLAGDPAAARALLERAEHDYRLHEGRGFLRSQQPNSTSQPAPSEPGGQLAAPDLRASPGAASRGEPAPQRPTSVEPPAAQPPAIANSPLTRDRASIVVDAGRGAAPPPEGGEPSQASTGRAPPPEGYAGILPPPAPDVPQETEPAPAFGTNGGVATRPRVAAPEGRKTTEAVPPPPVSTERRLNSSQCRELLMRAQIGDASQTELGLLRSACR